MKPSTITKIALIRRNGFGDFLCAVPLIKYIEQCYPNAEITLFVDQRNHAIVPYFFPHLTTVVFPQGNKYISMIKTALRYRADRFDLAISIKTSPMKLNNLFLGLLGAKQRIAIVNKNTWHAKLINQPRDERDYQQGHQALNCLRLFDPQLQPSILPSYYPTLELPLKPAAPCFDLPTLFLSVSNNFPQRTPSSELLASVANCVYKTQPFHVLISYQLQDRDKAVHLQQLLNMPADLCATPNLDDFLHLLNSADVVLVGDGGICHFAASLNKKLVALYTATQLEHWRPLSDNAICFQHESNVNLIPQADIIAAVEHLISLANNNKGRISKTVQDVA